MLISLPTTHAHTHRWSRECILCCKYYYQHQQGTLRTRATTGGRWLATTATTTIDAARSIEWRLKTCTSRWWPSLATAGWLFRWLVAAIAFLAVCLCLLLGGSTTYSRAGVGTKLATFRSLGQASFGHAARYVKTLCSTHTHTVVGIEVLLHQNVDRERQLEMENRL